MQVSSRKDWPGPGGWGGEGGGEGGDCERHMGKWDTCTNIQLLMPVYMHPGLRRGLSIGVSAISGALYQHDAAFLLAGSSIEVGPTVQVMSHTQRRVSSWESRARTSMAP